MKRILFLILLLGYVWPSISFAQPTSSDLMGLGMSSQLAGYFQDNAIASSTITNGSFIKSANATPAGAALNILKADTSNNTHLNALTGKVIDFDVSVTPIANIDANGLNFAAGTGIVYPAGAVVTPATNLTPVAGARIAAQRLGALATAAPTAVYVFAQPTLSVGKTFSVYNQGASPLNILPEDGSINAAAALTPFACSTGKFCDCTGLSTSQMLCNGR